MTHFHDIVSYMIMFPILVEDFSDLFLKHMISSSLYIEFMILVKYTKRELKIPIL